MSILDMKKRIHTQIDRTNLYRIGNFTDWFDLAHGLKHPMGEYRVAKAEAPAGRPEGHPGLPVVRPDPGQAHHPHLLECAKPPTLGDSDAGRGSGVESSEPWTSKPIPAKTFEIHDEGFIRNDANQDIERD